MDMEGRLKQLEGLLADYRAVADGPMFFRQLGYPAEAPIPVDLEVPESLQPREPRAFQLVLVGDRNTGFRVIHVTFKAPSLRRTDMRRFLEAYYRHYPQGENLFVFSALGEADELAFVSPRRLLDPRDVSKVRLWLRILQVRPSQPYRTDLEILHDIRADGIGDPGEIWRRHEEAFRVQRVTEQFYRDYSEAFRQIRDHLLKTHRHNGADWARDYAHQILNRIMFLYFIARKGWLHGPDGKPDRNFMRCFWEAYRQAGSKGVFHRDWLDVLLFEAFNNCWQNRQEYKSRFPDWLVESLGKAPYLNGGLYCRRPGLDDRLDQPLPDTLFELLFERWTDGTFPGLFERYNFTVVESGRLDEQVAVDPEMLGMVYERLVNVTFESGQEDEDQRDVAGIFYTARTEIDLMCRLALVDWLRNHLGDARAGLFYEWVFALSEQEKQAADQKVTQAGLWKDLDHRLRSVRVCDPACGSGSFLVGMLLVLDDLQQRCNQALGRSETPYDRRKRILQDQLYGVDVMEWAVRVAELRLWLQLVVETELQWWELKARPLLPNLTLKLRPGDSLVQTLGDLDLSAFRRDELPIPSHLQGRLNLLLGKKRRFFQAEESDLTEQKIRKEEQDLFREILQSRIEELRHRLVQRRNQLERPSAQPTLSGMEVSPPDAVQQQRLEAEIRQLEEQHLRYQKVKEALRPDQPAPFVWDLAFVEIFEEGGFDIVIGNPPYVRQEKIRDYLGRFNRDEYLTRLNESLRAIYPGFMGTKRRISGRADLYVYFYLHALSLLAEKGSFCFITSNSWLDVDFGKDLQEFFLRFGHLKMVMDNRAKRSFAQADVNTVIVLAGVPERRSPLSEEAMKARPVRFVAFRAPFEEVISPVIFSEIEDEKLYQALAGFRVLSRQEFRAILHNQWALFEEGLATPAEEPEEEPSASKRRTRRKRRDGTLMDIRPYAGNKWGGKYLRAPDIFFTILEKGRGKLVRLGDIAQVRRGFTTGANEFFYLEPVGRTVKEVAKLREQAPMTPVRVRNAAGWEGEIEAAWLRPVIKSPREIKTLRVRLDDLHNLVFMPPEDVRKAIEKGKEPPLSRYPKAAAYIRWGEKQDYPNRPTCASRQWWWDLGEQDTPPLVLNKGVNDRHFVSLNCGAFCDQSLNCGAFCDQQIYEMVVHSAIPLDVAAILNWTGTAIFWEQMGRRNFGEGVLWLAVYEANDVMLVVPEVFSYRQRHCLESQAQQLFCRPIRSIFEELGFPLCRQRRCEHSEHPYEHVRPESLTLEQVRRASPDRFELDRVVFDVLGLTEPERREVYQAVAGLVKDRLVKAKSV